VRVLSHLASGGAGAGAHPSSSSTHARTHARTWLYKRAGRAATPCISSIGQLSCIDLSIDGGARSDAHEFQICSE
jgi:hypothetical protein